MELLAIFLSLLLGIVVFVFTRRGFSAAEQRLLGGAFALHVVFAFLQVWVTHEIYVSGDMDEYWRNGVMLASLLRQDFFEFAPELLRMIFQQTMRLPIEIRGTGDSTGTMTGLTGFLMFFLSDSLYASGVLVTIAAYLGKLAIYSCFKPQFPEHLHRRVLVATLLVPSVVYWTAGIIKESFAITGMGFIIAGLMKTGRESMVRRAALVAVGCLIIGLIKPYILFPIALAAGAYVYCDRAVRSGRTIVVKPIYLVIGGTIALGGVVALGRIFPQFAFDRVSEALARQQGFAETVQGGSTYAIGDSTQTSTMAQLAFAPFGLVSALFRPFIFEVRNVPMAVGSIETTVLMIMFVRAISQQSWGTIKHRVLTSPVLIFCLVFTVVFGAAVGLATTNLGSLSRYRVPLVPFFAIMLAVITARASQAVAAAPIAKAEPVSGGLPLGALAKKQLEHP